MRRRAWAFWLVLALLAAYTAGHAARLSAGALAACLALFALALGSQVAYRSGAGGDSAWSRLLAWSGSIAMAVWATFLLLSLWADVIEALAVLARPLARLWPSPPAEALALAAAACLIAALGLVQALSGPRLREVEVPVGPEARALRGLRIVQISDLHVGPTIRAGYVEAVVRRALALEPDLIAVTGDLADGRPADLAAHVAPLARLKAPLGVFYVTGNHEYYWGAEDWIAKVAELGMTPLVDEGRVVETRGCRLLVAGVADVAASHFVPSHRGEPELAARAGAGCDFRLLLAHRPEVFARAEAAGFDLQLSGHTHGGQFFPFSLLIPLAHRYVRGLHKHGRLWLYVSTGTGYWGPVHRFAVPSELTLIRLV